MNNLLQTGTQGLSITNQKGSDPCVVRLVVLRVDKVPYAILLNKNMSTKGFLKQKFSFA